MLNLKFIVYIFMFSRDNGRGGGRWMVWKTITTTLLFEYHEEQKKFRQFCIVIIIMDHTFL